MVGWYGWIGQVNLARKVSVAELRRLRRQFLKQVQKTLDPSPRRTIGRPSDASFLTTGAGDLHPLLLDRGRRHVCRLSKCRPGVRGGVQCAPRLAGLVGRGRRGENLHVREPSPCQEKAEALGGIR
jgi:hypothetical protein